MKLKLLTETFISLIFSSLLANAVELVFPDNFKFGAASAAYQIEGAWNVDGRGPSIWDTFTHAYPERINDGTNGDDACRSYDLYEEDVKALVGINAQFYRFSVSWSRVMTTGYPETRNQLGIDYYNNLINALIANGIEPMITIFHYDMPQPIEDDGGLLDVSFIEKYSNYADLLFTEFGDRVKNWITFNEPGIFCNIWYVSSLRPPELRQPGITEYICTHYVILSHAKTYRLYNDKFSSQGGHIGLTIDVWYQFPAVMDDYHIEARNRALEFQFGIFAHPLIKGDYPPMIRERVDANSYIEGYVESRLLRFTPEELKLVTGAIDFIGINYYTSTKITQASTNDFDIPSLENDEYTHTWIDESWPEAKSTWLRSVPEGLYDLLIWIRDHYNNFEVRITENGWSDNGELQDHGRIDYLRGHYEAIHRALLDGCNVTAHAAWSIIDNFEWLQGYTEKFGIYRVDIEDPERKRVEKASVAFLREFFSSKILIVE